MGERLTSEVGHSRRYSAKRGVSEQHDKRNPRSHINCRSNSHVARERARERERKRERERRMRKKKVREEGETLTSEVRHSKRYSAKREG